MFFWLGGFFDESTLLRERILSPAANRWQRGLITALRGSGARVVAIGHPPAQVWPRGPAFARTERRSFAADPVASRLLSYPNLPGFRHWWLLGAYAITVSQLLKLHGHPRAVLSYNATRLHAAVGLSLQRWYGIPWIPFVAEGQARGYRRLCEHDMVVRLAAGRVFLPWHTYLACRRRPKLHLDGGVDCLSGREEAARSRAVLFAGAFSRPAGLQLLLESFRLVRDPTIELWVCGHGDSSGVEAASRRDQRIKFFGKVSDARLSALSRMAAAFVNPRPTKLFESRDNFPSKVLEYLCYGKPVISTWTAGLEPAYREVLLVVDDDPQAMASAIEEVVGWDASRLKTLEESTRHFLKSRGWSFQARRFLDWLDESGI